MTIISTPEANALPEQTYRYYRELIDLAGEKGTDRVNHKETLKAYEKATGNRLDEGEPFADEGIFFLNAYEADNAAKLTQLKNAGLITVENLEITIPVLTKTLKENTMNPLTILNHLAAMSDIDQTVLELDDDTYRYYIQFLHTGAFHDTHKLNWEIVDKMDEEFINIQGISEDLDPRRAAYFYTLLEEIKEAGLIEMDNEGVSIIFLQED